MGGATNFSRLTRRFSLLLAGAVIGASSIVSAAGAASDNANGGNGNVNANATPNAGGNGGNGGGGAGNASINLDQCANGNGSGTVACSWQNGNLNGNNSVYNEGDVVPFRLALDGLSAGTHTVHINYDFTAGGHKAYDFLAAFDSTENVDLCASGGGALSSLCDTPADETNLPAAVTATIPSDPATIDSQLVSAAETFSGLTRALTVFNATNVVVSAPVHSGDPSGNSSADILVTFDTTGNNQSVLMAWGGHLAASSYWTVADGSGNVTGAPWHMRTLNLDDGGAANQDRSIQPSAISPRGSITVVKQTLPDGSTQSFSFDPSWSDTNFSLTDGHSFDSGELVPGTYSVAELTTPGWTQTSATCNDGSPVTAIVLAADEAVTCTFTNTADVVPPVEPQVGRIVVEKVTLPVPSTQAFNFTADWDADGFTLANGGSVDSGDLEPGTYAVAETPATGWTLTSAVCDDGSNPASIDLEADETVTCRFTNTRIAVEVPIVTPAGGGGGSGTTPNTQTEGATETRGDNPTTDVATVTAVPPADVPKATAPVTIPQTALSPADELARTGAAGLREETLLGLLLMLAGLLARGAGRRNRPSDI